VLCRRSIRRYAIDLVEHTVAVPAADVALFRDRLAGDPGVRVVAQQEVVSAQFYPRPWVPAVKKLLGRHVWRLDGTRYVGRPGWIVQQIVKLSAPEICGSGPVCLVDSDLVFVRTFGRHDLLPGDAQRVLVREDPAEESAMHRAHMENSRLLLGLPPGPTEHHYMAYPAVFYGDWVLQLRARLEQVHGKPWQQVLREAETLSEYLLYGVFVEEILQPANMQLRRVPSHVGVWNAPDVALFARDPVGFVRSAPADPITLVVQSTLGLPAPEYQRAIEALLAG
jgi:hypothetical protein